MDFNSFFTGQQFNYMHNGVPMQSAFQEDQSETNPHHGESIESQQEVFDPSIMFQTPYDAFRFDSSLQPNNINDLSVSLQPSAEHTTHTTPLQDHSDSQIPESALPRDRRSSSDEVRLTPAQSRRKAQNRAAQKAFRERKERHVKNLEDKLTDLESSATNLASDNQKLKLALQRAMTENEMWRATNGVRNNATPLVSNIRTLDPTPPSNNMTDNDDEHGEADTGQLLSMARVWDYLIEHPLVKAGRVDIIDTVDQLKRLARKNKRGGGGAIFSERDVRRAIESSKRAGGDALI